MSLIGVQLSAQTDFKTREILANRRNVPLNNILIPIIENTIVSTDSSLTLDKRIPKRQIAQLTSNQQAKSCTKATIIENSTPAIYYLTQAPGKELHLYLNQTDIGNEEYCPKRILDSEFDTNVPISLKDLLFRFASSSLVTLEIPQFNFNPEIPPFYNFSVMGQKGQLQSHTAYTEVTKGYWSFVERRAALIANNVV